VTEGRFWRQPVSETFHGRDILAPVAAHWSLGVDVAEFGPPIDPGALANLARPVVRWEPNLLIGEIEFIDAFGNCISNISESDLRPDDDQSRYRVEIAGRLITGISRCYADEPPGSFLVLIGSSGLLEVAQTQGHAAQALKIGTGAEIRVRFI
jgi:S-adenosylmethionine hydrolase